MTRLSGGIIAAGRGDRLRDASNGVPKPLVEIGGEALLMRQIRILLMSGAKPVHVIVNSETAEWIRRLRLSFPCDVDMVVRDTANSMESLLVLGERIALGRVVMATVDSVLRPEEFASFVERAERLTNPEFAGHFDGALGVANWRGDPRPLFAEVAANGEIVALNRNQSRTVTAGFYLLPTSIFEYAAEARRLGLDALRRFLDHLVVSGVRLAAVELQGVIDIDERADLEAARAMLAHS